MGNQPHKQPSMQTRRKQPVQVVRHRDLLEDKLIECFGSNQCGVKGCSWVSGYWGVGAGLRASPVADRRVLYEYQLQLSSRCVIEMLQCFFWIKRLPTADIVRSFYQHITPPEGSSFVTRCCYDCVSRCVLYTSSPNADEEFKFVICNGEKGMGGGG